MDEPKFNSTATVLRRLTDPPESRWQTNLTLRRLVEIVKADQVQNSALAGQLKMLCGAAEEEGAGIRHTRYKTIAHSDNKALTCGEELPPDPGTLRIEASFDVFDEMLNEVQECYGGQRIPRDCPEAGGDAKGLVDHLRQVFDAGSEAGHASMGL